MSCSDVDPMCKGSKFDLAEKKRQEMKVKNEAYMKRFEEVKADKVAAEQENCAITAVQDDDDVVVESPVRIKGKTEEEWKAERKAIDEQRIARHKDNSGSYRREWDVGKSEGQSEDLDLPYDSRQQNYKDSRQGSSTREWDKGKWDRENRNDGVGQQSYNGNWQQRNFRGRRFSQEPPIRRGGGSARFFDNRNYSRSNSNSSSSGDRPSNFRRPSGRRGSDGNRGSFSGRRFDSESSNSSSSNFRTQRNNDWDRNSHPRAVYGRSMNQKEKSSSGTWSDEENTSALNEEDIPKKEYISSKGNQGASSSVSKGSCNYSGTWSDEEVDHEKDKSQHVSSSASSKQKHTSSGTWSDEDEPCSGANKDSQQKDRNLIHKKEQSFEESNAIQQRKDHLITNSPSKKHGHISSGTWSDEDEPCFEANNDSRPKSIDATFAKIGNKQEQRCEESNARHHRNKKQDHVSTGTWSDEDELCSEANKDSQQNKDRNPIHMKEQSFVESNASQQRKDHLIRNSPSKKQGHISSGTWSDEDEPCFKANDDSRPKSIDATFAKTSTKQEQRFKESNASHHRNRNWPNKKQDHVSTGTWSDEDDELCVDKNQGSNEASIHTPEPSFTMTFESGFKKVEPSPYGHSAEDYEILARDYT